jgi:hypothetical protein
MSRTDYRYRAYGLRIRSEVPLAPFITEERGPSEAVDVAVRLTLPSGDRQPGDVEFEPVEALRVLVRNGETAFLQPAPGLPREALAEFVSGVVFAVVLQQRGALVLHASAARIGDGAVAFTGFSGAGKSTTARAFAEAGCEVVTDDFLPVWIDGRDVTCQAGPGALKLLQPQPIDTEGGATATLGGKWLVRPAAPRHHGATSLLRVYVIEDAPEFAIVPLAGQRAIAALLRDAFCLATAGPRRRAALLEQCAAVAERRGVRALRRPRAMERVSEMVKLVNRDLTNLDRESH